MRVSTNSCAEPIFLASLLAFIPIDNIFQNILQMMTRVVPPDSMGVVRLVLHDVLRKNPELLSFSIASSLFAASGSFVSLITALNVAYDVGEGRPFWKKWMVAFGLTLLTGAMVTLLLVATALGPQIGATVAGKLHVGELFFSVWPYLRWPVIGAFTVVSVEIIYFLGPNVKQRFVDQIPGAVVAVASWLAVCWILGWYLSHFANYNRTFGTLGAVMGLMLWFYVSAIALMLGAELNAELARSKGRKLHERESSDISDENQSPVLIPAEDSKAKAKSVSA